MLPVLALLAAANIDVYTPGTGALASGLENWLWSSTIEFASTSGPGGTESVAVTSDAWAALSLYAETKFDNKYAGLKFNVAGDALVVSLYLTSASNDNSVTLPLVSMVKAPVTANAWTTVTVDFGNRLETRVCCRKTPMRALSGFFDVERTDFWDSIGNRINFQGGANGATYFITNIVLLDEIIVTPKFLSAEPLAGHIIAITSQGAVDFSQVSATLGGKALTLTKGATYSPPGTPAQTITYFTSSSPFAAGTLAISTGGNSTTFAIPAVQYGTVNVANTKLISPDVYGVNFPTDAAYISLLGVTVSRWGGNAVTANNPNGQFTNAGNDWYFENRVASPPDVDAWICWAGGTGSKSLLAIPALDWVSKDATSYSYPRSKYLDQTAYGPYNSDTGNGQLPNGSWVAPPTQSNVYTRWNISLASARLKGLKNKPTLVAVDNEIEIVGSTHQDMHPNPMGYDEELKRVLATATMAKSALPDVLAAAPSTCAWWLYWTSSIGYIDHAARNKVPNIRP